MLSDDEHWQAWDDLATQADPFRRSGAARDSDEHWEIYDTATRWWHTRQLDSAWLRHVPGIWLWRVAERMHIRWDARIQSEEGLPAWTVTTGMQTLPVDTFMDEVTRFHARFMTAMADRIAAARREWPRPDVSLDFNQLESEQAWRSGYLEEILAAEPDEPDWAAVLAAISRLDHNLTNL